MPRLEHERLAAEAALLSQCWGPSGLVSAMICWNGTTKLRLRVTSDSQSFSKSSIDSWT